MATDCSSHLTLWTVHRQQVTVTFDGGQLVQDAGLLPLRAFDKRLGFLADLAQRLPDPRYQPFVTHSLEDLLTQHVYQLLAGYPDANDADHTRRDPVFQTLADLAPDPQTPLASRSTLSRLQYAFTRRQHQLPPEDRPAFADMYTAQTRRLFLLNDFL